MAVFLVDNDKTYTYEDLFCSLNHAIEYCPLLKTRDVYVYFVNLIRASGSIGFGLESFGD